MADSPEILDYASPAPEPIPSGPVKGALAIIFFIVFMDLLGFGIIIPLLPRYIPDYEAHAMKVTLLFSVYSLCQFIGAPILGLISDRYGRRPVLALSQAGSAIGYVLLGVATDFTAGSIAATLVLIYISRIIDGFTGGNLSTAQAYVSDVTTPQNRAKGMGVLGAAFGIGFSFGPAIGGLLGIYRVSLPAYVAAAFSAAAAIITFLCLPESRKHTSTEAEVWLHPSQFAPIFRKPVVVQLLLLSFTTMAGFVMMESTVVLLLGQKFGYGPWGTGWFFAFTGFIIIIVQGGFIGRLTKKFGDWPLAIAGPLLVALGMLGFVGSAIIGGLALLLIAAAVNAIGRSLQQPTVSSLISKYADRKEQGVVFGLYHGLGSLARVAGPAIAGYAYTKRIWGPYATAAAIAAICFLWMLHIRRRAARFTIHEPTAEAALSE